MFLFPDVRYILVPVTRIEFGRINGRGDGQQENNDETVLGVFRLLFNTTRTRERSRYRPPLAGVQSGPMGWTRRETRTGLWSGSHAGLPDAVDRRRLGRSGLIRSEDGAAGGPQTQSGRSVSHQSDTRRDGYPQRQSVGYPMEACLVYFRWAG